MKSLFAVTAVAVALSSGAAYGASDGWTHQGDFVKFGGLVENPDFTIQYIVFDPKGVATFMIARVDGQPADRVQVDLPKNETRNIVVKRDCDGYPCRSYVVTIIWELESPDSPGTISIDYDVRIVGGSGNS